MHTQWLWLALGVWLAILTMLVASVIGTLHDLRAQTTAALRDVAEGLHVRPAPVQPLPRPPSGSGSVVVQVSPKLTSVPRYALLSLLLCLTTAACSLPNVVLAGAVARASSLQSAAPRPRSMRRQSTEPVLTRFVFPPLRPAP